MTAKKQTLTTTDSIVFLDMLYKHRTFKIGSDPLTVTYGRVSVSDPKHIAALDDMPNMLREVSIKSLGEVNE